MISPRHATGLPVQKIVRHLTPLGASRKSVACGNCNPEILIAIPARAYAIAADSRSIPAEPYARAGNASRTPTLHTGNFAKPYAISKMQRRTPGVQYRTRPKPYGIAANAYCIAKMQYRHISQTPPIKQFTQAAFHICSTNGTKPKKNTQHQHT